MCEPFAWSLPATIDLNETERIYYAHSVIWELSRCWLALLSFFSSTICASFCGVTTKPVFCCHPLPSRAHLCAKSLVYGANSRVKFTGWANNQNASCNWLCKYVNKTGADNAPTSTKCLRAINHTEMNQVSKSIIRIHKHYRTNIRCLPNNRVWHALLLFEWQPNGVNLLNYLHKIKFYANQNHNFYIVMERRRRFVLVWASSVCTDGVAQPVRGGGRRGGEGEFLNCTQTRTPGRGVGA